MQLIYLCSVLGRTNGERAKPLSWSGRTGGNDLNSYKAEQKETLMTRRNGGTVTERSQGLGGWNGLHTAGRFSPAASPPSLHVGPFSSAARRPRPMPGDACQQPHVRTVVAKSASFSWYLYSSPSPELRACVGLRTFPL